MKQLIITILLAAFCIANTNAQVIFKPSTNVHPLHPNGKPIQRNGKLIKPKPVVVVKPKPHVQVIKPHPHKPGQDSRWVKGHWLWDQQKKKKVWVDGYWIHRIEGQIYMEGHWVQGPHGLKWIPGHWIYSGLPKFKGKK